MRAYACRLASGLGAVSMLACCHASTEPSSVASVSFQLAAAGAPGAGPAELTSFRIVAGPAALGSDGQFGCLDCSGSEVTPPAALVSVPLDGTPVELRTEQVTPGHYTAAELELQAPDSSLLAAMPDWPAMATVEVAGRFNGVPFTLHLALVGSFRETLDPAVDIAAGSASAPVAVTVTLPVASWFVANGVALDPNVAAQRAQIEQNARSSLLPPESGTAAEATE